MRPGAIFPFFTGLLPRLILQTKISISWTGPEVLIDKRDQSVFHLVCVFGIAGQILAEEFFLVKQPPYYRWHYDDEPTNSPPRSERKWDACQQRQYPGVHRVLDICIEAC